MEVKRLTDENNVIKQELEIEKEKLHTLEAAFESIRKRGRKLKKSCAVGNFFILVSAWLVLAAVNLIILAALCSAA